MFENQTLRHGNRALASAHRNFLHAKQVLLSVFPLAALLVLTASATAQTAHFSGSYLTVPTSGLSSPFGVAVDGGGNVYVADTGNNRVAIETPSAGGYTQSVVATSTPLSGPRAVAIDASGSLYIADTDNDRVVKETPATSGGVTAWAETLVANLAVNGLYIPTSVAVDSNGVVYIASAGNDLALKMTPVAGGGYSEAVLNPGLVMLYGIAVDAHFNLYYADYTAGKVYVSVWNGTAYGAALLLQSNLSNPAAVAVDGAGNVYIADSGHGQIYKDTFEGNSYIGSQLVFPLNNPLGVAVDASGNVYIANTGTNQILESTGGNFGTVAIGTKSAPMILNFVIDSSVGLYYNPPTGDFPSSIDCLETANPYDAPKYIYSAGDLCSVSITFKPTMAGLRTGAFDLTAYTQFPDGDVWTLATAFVHGFGSGPQISFPAGTQTNIHYNDIWQQAGPIAVDPSGNIVLIDVSSTDLNLDSITQGTTSYFAMISTPEYAVPSSLWAVLPHPQTVAVDAGYNLYEYDGNSAVDGVMKWSQNSASVTPGALPQSWTAGNYIQNGTALFTSSPESYAPAIAVDGSGNVYITDAANSRVLKETPSGSSYIQTTVADASAGLGNPLAVAVDGYGNVYIANLNENGSYEIYKETLSNGIYSSSVIDQDIHTATAIAVDADGNVYYVDRGLGEVFKLTLTSGSYVQSQVQMFIGSTMGIAFDESGNLYVSDPYNYQIVKKDYADPPSLNFPTAAVYSASAAQTVTVQNSGTSNLNFSEVSYPANFPEASSAASECTSSTSLVPGASCTVTVAFSPTAAGALGGAVLLTDNSYTGSQSISVSGSATQTAQAINITSNLPGTVTYTPGLTYTLSAIGGASGNPVTFSLVYGQATVVGNTLTINGTGTVTVAANQLGDAGYTAAPQQIQTTFVVAAELLSPQQGLPLPGSSATFTWTKGSGVSEYWLYIGTLGNGSTNVYNSSVYATSATVTNLPTLGQSIYVRLLAKVNGTWQYSDYVYTAATIQIPAAMSTPASGSVLPGSTATFTWTKGSGVSEYWLYMGTKGTGSTDLYNSSAATTSANVANLPTFGQTVYVRLLSKINGAWQFNDTTYTEAGSPAAVMISPASGSTLSGSSAAFTWTKGLNVSEYWLYIGTKGAGSTNVYNSSVFTTSANVTTLPVNGATVYVRLLSKINGAWQFNDYTYTAQ